MDVDSAVQESKGQERTGQKVTHNEGHTRMSTEFIIIPWIPFSRVVIFLCTPNKTQPSNLINHASYNSKITFITI